MTDRAYGALPPAEALHQIGDRADKACVLAAVVAAHGLHVDIEFDAMQTVIDAYLASAAKHGWKLS